MAEMLGVDRPGFVGSGGWKDSVAMLVGCLELCGLWNTLIMLHLGYCMKQTMQLDAQPPEALMKIDDVEVVT